MRVEENGIKDRACIICYIGLLQNNISRMSNYSGIIKAAMCVVYTIITTVFVTLEEINSYWWIGVFLTVLCSIIDAYYLALEKIYVIKYNSFIVKLNKGIIIEDEIYDMKPKNSDLKCELLAMVLSSMKSFSILGFYGIFIIISIIIKFI